MTGTTTLRHVIAGIVGNSAAPLAAIATMPIMAHALGTAGRGTVAAAMAPLLLAVPLASFGLPLAVTFMIARTPSLVQHVVRPVIMRSVALGAVASAGTVSVSGLLAQGDDQLRTLLCCASLAIVPQMCAAVLQAAAAGLAQWRLIAIERIVTNGLRLVALSILVCSGALTVGATVAVLATSPVVGAAVYLPAVIRRASTAADPIAVHRHAVMSYGARVWVGSISGIVLARIDQVLLTPMVSAADLGLYVVAVGLSELPLVVNNAIREVMFVSDSARTDDATLLRAGRVSTLITLVCAAVVAGTAPWVLPIVFGSPFSAALPTCLVLLAGVVLGNPGSIAGVALAARGRPGLRSVSLTIACAVNVVAMYVLGGAFGVIGAAVAAVLGSVVAGGCNLVFLHRTTTIRPSSFFGLRPGDLHLPAGPAR